jgi:DNA-binding MarR family transcriptional regulator
VTKLVSADRCNQAAWRLSRYRLKKVIEQYGPLSEVQMLEVRRRALVPRIVVRMVKRLSARGWIIIDPETREILRFRGVSVSGLDDA